MATLPLYNLDGDEVGIVNGVLDRVGRIARPAEFGGEG